MPNLTEYDIQFLIEKLQKDKPIPEDFKYKLFPIKQKEYELVYAGKMRKEDIIANQDGVFPVPLQIEKVFNRGEYFIVWHKKVTGMKLILRYSLGRARML